jgi:hypothetical protein
MIGALAQAALNVAFQKFPKVRAFVYLLHKVIQESTVENSRDVDTSREFSTVLS